MSIVTTHTVYCDACGNKFAEESAESIDDAINLSRRQGFVRDKVQNGSMWDFCQECYQRHINSKT